MHGPGATFSIKRAIRKSLRPDPREIHSLTCISANIRYRILLVKLDFTVALGVLIVKQGLYIIMEGLELKIVAEPEMMLLG